MLVSPPCHIMVFMSIFVPPLEHPGFASPRLITDPPARPTRSAGLSDVERIGVWDSACHSCVLYRQDLPIFERIQVLPRPRLGRHGMLQTATQLPCPTFLDLRPHVVLHARIWFARARCIPILDAIPTLKYQRDVWALMHASTAPCPTLLTHVHGRARTPSCGLWCGVCYLRAWDWAVPRGLSADTLFLLSLHVCTGRNSAPSNSPGAGT